MRPATHYDVLGLHPGASDAAVRDAYRRRARMLHPDTGGDADAMRALNEAWAVLGDPALRSGYDRLLGVHARSGAPGAPAGVGPSAADCVQARPLRLRLWPLLVLAALALIVVTAYAGSPRTTRSSGPPVGRCFVERPAGEGGAAVACPPAGGRRIVAVGSSGAVCPSGSARRRLDGDLGVVCVATPGP